MYTAGAGAYTLSNTATFPTGTFQKYGCYFPNNIQVTRKSRERSLGKTKSVIGYYGAITTVFTTHPCLPLDGTEASSCSCTICSHGGQHVTLYWCRYFMRAMNCFSGTASA